MIKYLDVFGNEVTLDDLTEEFLMINDWNEQVGAPTHDGPLDYEVQQYIQRLLERNQLEIEVWN